MYVAPELRHIPQAVRLRPGVYVVEGRVGPSVTRILGETESDDFKRIIANWRDGIGHDVADRIRDGAAARGSALHEAIEAVACGDEPTTDIPPAIQRFLATVDRILGVEVPLVHKDLWYTGTADMIVIHNGVWKIVDWKTCTRQPSWSNVSKWDRQLAAYARALASWGLPLPAGYVYAVPDGAPPVPFDLGHVRMAQAWTAFEANLAEFRTRKSW